MGRKSKNYTENYTELDVSKGIDDKENTSLNKGSYVNGDILLKDYL